MKFNGTQYTALRGDDKKYNKPKLSQGCKIKVLFDDENQNLPGCKIFKKGIYLVKSCHKSYVGIGDTYDLILDRKNSKYIYPICTIDIDKAIEDKAIDIIYLHTNN